MKLGASFRNYEDFRERLRAFERAQGCRYGLQSCVSVRCYNRQHRTALRQDIMFMQATFACAQTPKYSKRKQQDSLCPAYFVLQYKEDVDLLVISELNGDHVHADPAPPLTGAPAAAAANTTACDGPATKLPEEEEEEEEQLCGTGSVAVVDEEVQEVAGELMEEVSVLYDTPEAAKASVLVRAAEVMKAFLRADEGSLASIGADSSYGLERLSFQTSKMKSLFMQFPESLLLHRVLSEEGHVLYAFVAESKEQVGQVVHLSLLKEDRGHIVRKMLTVFKEFNPEWQKVQAVFMDASFFHKAILQELFPSARVFLSIYHAVRLLEKNVKEVEISSSFKQSLLLALQKAAFAPSAANLNAMAQLAQHVVSPELYDYLRANWFSCEPLWCMPAEKGLQFFTMDSLDLIMCQISSLFGQQSPLEASILRFMACVDSLVSKGSESPNWGFLSTEDSQSGLWEKQDACTSGAAEHGPVPGFPTPAKLHKQAAAVERNPMLAMLWENCVELSCWLCLKEWEVVQRSAQLLSPGPDSFTVWMLEEAHQVSRDYRSCTCSFHRRYRLPCRHVLAVLQVHGACVEKSMVCRRWQKRFQQLPVPGATPQGCGGSLVGAHPEGRGEMIWSLNLELATLLMQCDREELEERGSRLTAILAAWAQS
ncbi:ZSWM3 protein, partial [Jacana jacana]|nr:ZSWM3 protein [Jacana jacana]